MQISNINTVRWSSVRRDQVVVNGTSFVPANTGNRHWNMVQEWVAEGNEIANENPPAPEPTNAELIDLAGPVLVAFLKAYAAREGITMAQVKNTILAQM